MAEETELESLIREEAAKTESVSSPDIGSFKRRSLSELIEADKHLQNNDAVDDSPRRGLRFNKLRPPGAA